jgi:hypothetical protein
MKSWIKFGLIWGVFMFLILNIAFPLFDKEPLNINKMLVSFPFWLVGGLIFGYVSRKKTPNDQTDNKS